MSTLKTVGAIALAFVVFVVVALVLLGHGLFSVGTAVVEQANAPVEQTVTMDGPTTVITLPLQPRYGLVFDVSGMTCEPEGQKDFLFDRVIVEGVDNVLTEVMCSAGRCQLSIEMGEHGETPSAVYAYILEEDGECIKQSLPDQKPEVTGYAAVIEMTPELEARLGVVGRKFKVRSVNSTGVSSWQIMGTKKVELSYDKQLSSDSLTIDGKPVATLRFSENPAP